MATLAQAVERSTYVITTTFTDESGAAVVPTSCTWSLRNNAGEIVNSRSSVATVIATAITIVLTADDLMYEPTVNTTRVLTIQATYSSDIGAGLPLVDEFVIPIRPIEGV
jgi:hypothetical protein